MDRPFHQLEDEIACADADFVTVGMRRIQRSRNLTDHGHRGGRIHRAVPGEQGSEVITANQPPVDVEQSVDLAEVVNRDDMRFLQTCRET